MNENSKCGYAYKRNILVPKVFDVAEIFYFAQLPLYFHVQSERSFVKLFGGMWEKELIIDVQCRQEIPNSRVRHSNGKLSKPRFQLERCPQWILFTASLSDGTLFHLCSNIGKKTLIIYIENLTIFCKLPCRLSSYVTRLGKSPLSLQPVSVMVPCLIWALAWGKASL